MTDTAAVDLQKQAEASVKANADYQDPVSATRIQRVPQLPDPEKLELNQSVSQGGNRPVPDSVFEGVDIQDDGSRVGEGASDPQAAAKDAVDEQAKAAKKSSRSSSDK